VDGLASQWDALVADEPEDWSHAALTLRLHDPERMEEAALVVVDAAPGKLAPALGDAYLDAKARGRL